MLLDQAHVHVQLVFLTGSSLAELSTFTDPPPTHWELERDLAIPARPWEEEWAQHLSQGHSPLTKEAQNLRKSHTVGTVLHLLCVVMDNWAFRGSQACLSWSDSGSASVLMFIQFPALSRVYSVADNFLLNLLLAGCSSSCLGLYHWRNNSNTDDNNLCLRPLALSQTLCAAPFSLAWSFIHLCSQQIPAEEEGWAKCALSC